VTDHRIAHLSGTADQSERTGQAVHHLLGKPRRRKKPRSKVRAATRMNQKKHEGTY
jgi:hypothetical protein